MTPDYDLTLVWAAILLFAVFAYVLMDGFDLGIGILFPSFAVGRVRDQAMNSIAPVWDGNETWLVLGGAALLGAFPLAYAVILSALYLPLMLMLAGLVCFATLLYNLPDHYLHLANFVLQQLDALKGHYGG